MMLFTAILAIAVRRAHWFLVTSVSESKAARDLARFMPDDVAEQIRVSDQKIEAGEGVRRDAAILNVDIRGFTTIAGEMDPQKAMELLSNYQHRVVPIVHRHGGLIDKYMGDGILVTFGASTADPHYCANALRCADEIIANMRSWSGLAATLPVNLAIASGPVIYGAVGDGDRLEYTVIGAAVNASAKLEKHNKTLSTVCICDRQTFDTALAQGYVAGEHRNLKAQSVDGGTRQIDLVVLA